MVAAMAAEARALRPLRRNAAGLSLRNDGTLVSISGIGGPAATAGAHALLTHGATALMSFGMAGGLDPTLRPGRIVLPHRVITLDGAAYATARAWGAGLAAQVPAGMPPPAHGVLLTTDRAIDGAEAKAALFRATGAVAVDMESAAIAKVAAEHGLPFMAVRVIVDAAEDTLPPSVVAASDAGELNLTMLLAGLLRAPAEILPLLRLAHRYAAAKRSLTAMAAVLRPAAP